MSSSPGLTSVRWEPYTAVYQQSSHQALHFDPALFTQNVRSSYYQNAPAGLVFSGDPQYSCGNSFNCNPLSYATGFNRANILSGSFDVNWNNYYKGLPVFNVNKFAFPGVWTIGNAAPLYQNLRSPFQSNETVGLKKKFFFGERITAELEVTFDNILNRMRMCGGPDREVTDTNFGIINGGSVCQGNTPRRGQAFFTVKF